MTGRISASRPSTTQRTATASQPRASAQARPSTRAAEAGWRSGAGAAQPLRITAARIGDGPRSTDRISVPPGFKAEVKSFEMSAKDRVHGEDVSLTQSVQQLTITSPSGKPVTFGGPELFEQFANDWKSEVAATKRDPKPEYGVHGLNWDAQSSIRGAGTAGRLVSLMEGGSSFMGGAHPNHGTALRTYDASTGKPVKLESLLSQRQMTQLVNDIAEKLATLKGRDGVDGAVFGSAGEIDKADIRRTINENFAVTTDRSGKVKLEIAWASGVHALGGLMAHFTVDAPTDAAFRSKLGL